MKYYLTVLGVASVVLYLSQSGRPLAPIVSAATLKR